MGDWLQGRRWLLHAALRWGMTGLACGWPLQHEVAGDVVEGVGCRKAGNTPFQLFPFLRKQG